MITCSSLAKHLACLMVSIGLGFPALLECNGQRQARGSRVGLWSRWECDAASGVACTNTGDACRNVTCTQLYTGWYIKTPAGCEAVGGQTICEQVTVQKGCKKLPGCHLNGNRCKHDGDDICGDKNIPDCPAAATLCTGQCYAVHRDGEACAKQCAIHE